MATTRGTTTLWGCGGNESGQLAGANLNPRLTPQPIRVSNDSILRIACGAGTSYAMTVAGDCYAWGRNNKGQLGIGTVNKTPVTKPSKVLQPKYTSAVNVHAGWEHACLVAVNGSLVAFGSNDDGQLGTPQSPILQTPTQMWMPGQSRSARAQVVSVGCGMHHSLVATDAGDVWAMGWGEYGQLGTGNTANASSPAKVLTPPSQMITKVSCGLVHSAALTASGQLLTWGWGEYGQLGHVMAGSSHTNPNINSTASQGNKTSNPSGSVLCSCVATPTRVCAQPLANENCVFAVAGSAHTLVLTDEGRVYSFGMNEQGQCGVGDLLDVFKPRLISVLRKIRIIDIACGCDHSLFLSDIGEVYTCGSGEYGQTGHGNTQHSPLPKLVQQLTNCRVAKLAAGFAHSLVVSSEGVVYGFGWARSGQLGAIGSGAVLLPTVISELKGHVIVDVACGVDHSLVLTDEGEVFAFGGNTHGQLGIGHTHSAKGILRVLITNNISTFSAAPVGEENATSDPKRKSVPPVVLQDGESVVNLSAGMHFSVARTSKGRVYSWGRGGCGQLGELDVSVRSVPHVITPLLGEEIQRVSAGYAHCVAISDAGEVCYTWGMGDQGQLGHGDTASHHTPQGIAGLDSDLLPQKRDSRSHTSRVVDSFPPRIRHVAAGGAHTVIITEHGNVMVCGSSEHGCLGIGHVNYLSIPTLVEASLTVKVVDISCGGDFTAYVTSGGALYTFGRNSSGQLGVGDVEHRHTPTRVHSLRNYKAIAVACGMEHTVALTDDQQAWAWGRNSDGQLGNGTATDCVLPQRIQTFTNYRVLSVACGPQHSLFVVSDQVIQPRKTIPRIEREDEGEGDSEALTLALPPKEKAGLLSDYLQMVNNKEHADVWLHVGHNIVFAHQLILDTRAPHFIGVLQKRGTGGLKQVPGRKDLNVDFCDQKCILSILEFVYTGRVEIDNASAVPVMIAADILKLQNLSRLCEDALIGSLNVSNCVKLYEVAAATSCAQRLKTASVAAIMENFEKVSASFDSLPRDVVLGLLEIRAQRFQ